MEQLREAAVGEETFFKEGLVVCLGVRELGVKTVGLGSHIREALFPNQIG